MTETMTAQELRTVRHRVAPKSLGGSQGQAGREVMEALIDQLRHQRPPKERAMSEFEPWSSAALAGAPQSVAQELPGTIVGGPAELRLMRLQTQFRRGLPPRVLQRVREYVETNLESNVSLQHLATVAGLSTSHFIRAFRQSEGTTPHRYLLCRRVRRALGLLSETEMPLAEIAVASGFADQSHFCRQFRRFIGAPPSHYRWSAR
jgi:transcriptional regulator GlxA family with amidase domain